MEVTHCICHNKLISEIVKEAKKKKLKTIEEISEMIGCCDRCQLCVPFIQKELDLENNMKAAPFAKTVIIK